MVGHGCASADVAFKSFCSCATPRTAEGRGRARALNCSFILCRRAPPLVPAARHFLCTALATCFLCWELPGNLATYSKMAFWAPGARWMTSSLS